MSGFNYNHSYYKEVEKSKDNKTNAKTEMTKI